MCFVFSFYATKIAGPHPRNIVENSRVTVIISRASDDFVFENGILGFLWARVGRQPDGAQMSRNRRSSNQKVAKLPMKFDRLGYAQVDCNWTVRCEMQK